MNQESHGAGESELLKTCHSSDDQQPKKHCSFLREQLSEGSKVRGVMRLLLESVEVTPAAVWS
jgi:hypothetical protein